MHAISTTLKKLTVVLGLCLVALGFSANSVWAQTKSDYQRIARIVHAPNVSDANAVAEQSSPAALLSSYPNPFNPEATIQFDVRKSQQVRLSVFNELGQRVMVLVDGRLGAGQHRAQLNAYGLPSGTYFLRLETETGVITRTVVLMK